MKGGGFEGLGPAPIAEIANWKLSGGEPAGECKPVATKELGPDDIADQALAGLKRLVGVFDRPETPYLDHPGGRRIGDYDAYVDVARTLEWRLGSDIMMPDLPLPPSGPRTPVPRKRQPGPATHVGPAAHGLGRRLGRHRQDQGADRPGAAPAAAGHRRRRASCA